MSTSGWLSDRFARHAAQLDYVRAKHPAAWAKHVGTQPGRFIPDFRPAPAEDVESLRERFPELPQDYVAFVECCDGFKVEGFQSFVAYRVLGAREVIRLRESDSAFVSKWTGAQGDAGMYASNTQSSRPRGPHNFDARELTNAIMLAADGGRGEEAIVWVPSPTAEYWRVASWEGCRRFKTMVEAIDHLLNEVVAGLDAALA